MNRSFAHRLIFSVFFVLLLTTFRNSNSLAAAAPTPPSNRDKLAALDLDCSSGAGSLPILNDICEGLNSMSESLDTMGQTLGDIAEALDPAHIAEWIIKAGVTAVVKGIFVASEELFLHPGLPSTIPNDLTNTGKQTPTAVVPGSRENMGFKMIRAFYQNQPRNVTGQTLAYVIGNTFIPTNTAEAVSYTNQTGRTIVSIVGPIWSQMRNLAYLVIVIFLVFFGFAVMFRFKLDPRTVITAESAIPALAFGLIAIAFSSLVPALFLDLSVVLQNTTASIFSTLNVDRTQCRTLGPGGPLYWCIELPLQQSPIQMSMGGPMDDPGKDEISALGITDGNLSWFLSIMLSWGLMITYITITLTLILRYASILLRTIFGPLLIALSLFPGQKSALSTWIRQMLADSLAIAAIYFMLNITVYLWDVYLTNHLLGGHPLTAYDLIHGAAGGGDITWVLSVAVAIMTTKVPAYIDDALGIAPTAASRSGVDLRQSMRSTPIIGGFLG